MLFQEDPRGEWRKHDFLLLEALQIMEQERCSQCGLPVWMCHDSTGGVIIEVESDECIAKRDVDKEQERASKKKNAEHGVSYYPNPKFVGGSDWLTVRDAYYREREQRARELAQD